MAIKTPKAIAGIVVSLTVVLLLLLIFQHQLLQALSSLGSKIQYPNLRFKCRDASDDRAPHMETTFQKIPALSSLSPLADQAWHQAALTRKGGFIWVEYNETANEAWGISMFHALHCLKMLRTVVQASPAVKERLTDTSPEDKGSSLHDKDHTHPPMNMVHIQHCIGYIAQVRLGRSFVN